MPRPDDKYLITKNPYQGNFPKVLFVCSAGILRSPTAAHWAAANCGWNTRSAGCIYGDEAGIPVSQGLIEWADKIYVMEQVHAEILVSDFNVRADKIDILNIPDQYEYRQPELIEILFDKFKAEVHERALGR